MTDVEANKAVEKYYHDVYKFCCAKCRNSDIGQDITQETFLIFVQRSKELTDINIRSWLLCTANNKLHEYFRECADEKNFISIYDIEIPIYDNYNLSSIGFESDDLFDETEKKILSCLNDKERILFTKLYLEKKTVDLIKEELDLTDENFRKRKSRLKKKVEENIRHIQFLLLVISFKLYH